MSRPYTPLAFANEFILKAAPQGAEHMKLQKLVYYAHGWWLAYNPTSILSESPQVWKHGPVFKSVYHVLKPFGHTPITTIQKDSPFGEASRIDETDEDVMQLVDWIFQHYGKYSSWRLSEFTHEKGSPWQLVAQLNGYQVPLGTTIPDSVVKEYFQKLASEYRPAN
jgi:uncharacterized phage-associated protein